MSPKEQKLLNLIDEYRYKALVLLEMSVRLRDEAENYSSIEEKMAAIFQIAAWNQEAADLNLEADDGISKLFIESESDEY